LNTIEPETKVTFYPQLLTIPAKATSKTFPTRSGKDFVYSGSIKDQKLRDVAKDSSQMLDNNYAFDDTILRFGYFYR
jgi:hypothetical protein